MLDPLNGMSFYCWVKPPLPHPQPKWYATSTHLCTWAKKGKVEKSFLSKETTAVSIFIPVLNNL